MYTVTIMQLITEKHCTKELHFFFNFFSASEINYTRKIGIKLR